MSDVAESSVLATDGGRGFKLDGMNGLKSDPPPKKLDPRLRLD